MIRTLALLSLIAAPAFGSLVPGFKRTFNAEFWESSAFVDMPRTNASAYELGWVQDTKPTGPEGYESLLLWCPEYYKSTCILTDPQTGNVTGLQIGIKKERFVPKFNMTELGFSDWNVTINGTVTEFYIITQYYMSIETLATDVSSRTSVKDDWIVQDEMYLTGFNGSLYNVSADTAYITDNTTSPYTKQACMIFMGHHYYYQMTTTMECNSKTLFPWFPLIYGDKLVGVGMMVFGTYNSTGEEACFEAPTKSAVELIVPNGPQCLYNLAEDGVVTMHTYFVENVVKSIFCFLESYFTS